MGFSLFACCHIVPNLSSMSVFPDFLFLSQPTHIHPLYSEWIHHSHFRKANDPFWLPNSQLQLQPEFPRSRKPEITTHSMGKRLTQTLLSNEKEVRRDKSSSFSPLKHGTATEQQQLQQDGTLTHFSPIPILEPNLVPSSPFPRPPFNSCSGCPPYLQWISQT